VASIAYLGTSDFAVTVLERLAASEHEVALVVTRPDRPKGRGRKLSPPRVAVAAQALGLPLAQPEDVHTLDLPAVDALVVCAFGALIKEPLLSAYEIFNVHPSLLPRWRGAAPVERAIMAGDAETGVAIMQLVAELDAGPVYAMEREPIRPDDDYGTLATRLAEVGAEQLIAALRERSEPAAQDEEGLTYAEKIGPSDRTLDPAAPPEERERVVRALRPHIGARVELADGSFLGVWAARVGEGGVNWRGLELLEVQPAGGRRMPADAWFRGHGAQSLM
jgi:methionyl-tRNA formyltransferase